MNIVTQVVVPQLENVTMRSTPKDVIRIYLLLATPYDLELETLKIANEHNTSADELTRLDKEKMATLTQQLIHPKCNLRKPGLLMFSNRDCRPWQPTTSGVDWGQLRNVTLIPL